MYIESFSQKTNFIIKEQAYEIDSENDFVKKKIAELYFEFGIEKYDEKDYQVFFSSTITLY